MDLIQSLKQRFKDASQKILRKLNNEHTYFAVRHLPNELIKCKWSLTKEDKRKLFSNDNYCLSLRLYDITQEEYNSNTCIMKEVEIKKSSKECFVKPVVSNGNLLIELGFRKPYDRWFTLASSYLKLGNREKSINEIYPDDSWFYSNSNKSNNEKSDNIHEKIYQLSRSFSSGGSEKIHDN